MSNWIEAAQIDDIPRQGSRVLQTPVGAVALFRTLDDQVYALLNRCPHKGGPLSQGIVHGQRVTCPLHSWVLDLASGQAVGPDVGCAQRFDVKITDGLVWLRYPEQD